MGAIGYSIAALRFFGDDLDPEEISGLLGAAPDESCRKDQELVSSTTGTVRVARTGSWRLKATDREPEDLEAQVFQILDRLTQDLAVWQSLARYQPDLFCGLFMGGSNDGLVLSAKALSALGQRGIELALDIYDPTEEEIGSAP